MANNDLRSARLNRLLDFVLKGKTTLTTSTQCKQFIEAICLQPDPPRCVERLIVSPHGIPSLKEAICADVSDKGIAEYAVQLLTYMQAPAIKTLSSGQLLQRVIEAIVASSSFWQAFTDAFKGRRLAEEGQKCFAWTLLQLLLMPSDATSPYTSLAKDIETQLCTSPYLDVRAFGQQIKHILSVSSSTNMALLRDSISPGGRHDNDFVDFRDIAILPTADELSSSSPPFLRPSAALEDPETEGTREAIHLDNQFRLLREDMIYEMREELQIATGQQKGKKHRGLVVDGLAVVSCDLGAQARRSKWSLVLQRETQFPQLLKKSTNERMKILQDNTRFLKHQSIMALVVDEEVLAFPTLRREEARLIKEKPQLILELEGEKAIRKLLLHLISAAGSKIKLIQIDVAVFAYEPILDALKSMKVLPLAEQLLSWKDGASLGEIHHSTTLQVIVDRLRRSPKTDVGKELGLAKKIVLDPAQHRSLLNGLTQGVSIIQGPPGTGKSFIGVILAKFFCDFSDAKILVVCYTNHALDQFLEDLLNIGIPDTSIVRIGGKSTSRTESTLLRRQQTDFRFTRGDNSIINEMKSEIETRASSLESAFVRYLQSSISDSDLLSYLEFEEPAFFEAFQVPSSDDGMIAVGKGGKSIDEFELIRRWRNGGNAGIFSDAPNVVDALSIWSMEKNSRSAMLNMWMENIRREEVDGLYETASRYNKLVDSLGRKFKEKDGYILKSKRIIGCTTTAAAKYTQNIHEAAPDVILVEEAGEILESHVLTALGNAAKQLILIGDHKQLRPKVNNYQLTVEKGDGYDLNMSLFERLVLKGYPHDTLISQHRMRPEISALIRHLTYPDLKDAPNTIGRPNLRGVQDNIIFINHDYPEDELRNVSEMRDMGSKSSKQNHYEVRMILKIVRYMAQQGYGTEKMVILTPYLGQLQKLRKELASETETDPVLNDLDSFDLIRAGLVTPGAAKANKKRLRLATIDNYQGEESDIVIASLTRSNKTNDIGFMFAPERLNVLLSRARDGLIMIGNSNTFRGSKKGGPLWTKFFDLIKPHVYDGFPVKCEQHSSRKALLSSEEQFDEKCPDGGCAEPCGTMLNCGLHKCPSKCHQLYDHTKMRCEEIINSKCPAKGHNLSYKCCDPQLPACKKCAREVSMAEAKQKKEFARQQKRDKDEAEHLRKKKEIEEKLEEERQIAREAQLRAEQENEIQMKLADLEEARKMNERAQSGWLSGITSLFGQLSAPNASTEPKVNIPSTPLTPAPRSQPPSGPQPSAPQPQGRAKGIATSAGTSAPSSAEAQWQRKKSLDGIVNASIDSIMGMTGLEDVKVQLLHILDKIEISGRQGASVAKERFNAVFLGNPGTGKTTVARHYAKFLSSVGVLPGNVFEETTGSNIASNGIGEAKKMLEKVINGGGGTIFVDEAYQLVSSGNFGGTQVLDFLLAEMENNVGKIVFILAGYNKQMEKFFEHNPGLPSRVPFRFQFNDYDDAELLLMFGNMLHKKYGGRMKVEDGIQGLYGRIVIKRLGRGRGREGFGNARALENLLATITNRQAERIAKERGNGVRADDLLLVKEDLIGPDPSTAVVQSKAWEKLQKLIGLASVKQSIQDFYDMVLVNYSRELKEQEILEVSLNRTFIGSPGTGKTTVAKLYGQILADLGLLSNGEVIVKNPADFIGGVLGESETKTKAILASSVGKVLIIDEAYMLYNGGATGQQSDPYKTAVIDTIVAEVQSTLGEDRCVLLLGYEKEMREMFQHVNPGLSRRFAIEDAFKFEDFTSDELLNILNLKLKQQDLDATPAAKNVALEVLNRSKLRPNFGNGGEVENLLGKAKTSYMSRNRGNRSALERFIFEPVDFDPDFDRGQSASDRLVELFEDVVGCDDIVAKLRRIQKTALSAKKRGENLGDLVPTTFVFKGPPGTGKTTTARKMGEVYFDMGMLARPTVQECSASDIVGKYVGHTGPLVREMFEKALGQVLFIDEAYRLKDGGFGKEATDEIVTLLTDDKFKGKIVVILAGYDNDINELLAINRGLSSRFTEEVIFVNLRPNECLQILAKDLAKRKIHLPGLDDVNSDVTRSLLDIFNAFTGLESWGNARDVKTLATKLISVAYQDDLDSGDNTGFLILDGTKAIETTLGMYKDRLDRQPVSPAQPPPLTNHLFAPSTPSQAPPPPRMKTSTVEQEAQPELEKEVHGSGHDGRDPGVSDAVWAELQAAIAASLLAQNRAEAEIAEARRVADEAVQKEMEEQKRKKDIETMLAQEQDRARQNELKRQREIQRLKEVAAKRERERLENEWRAKREAEEREKKKEAEVQRKIRDMGRCAAGFQWQNIGSGYRCTAGGHFLSNAQLGI